MSTSDEQFEFGKDIIKLLNYIVSKGDKFTLGEAHRPRQMQLLYYYGYRIVEYGKEIGLGKDIKLVKCKPKSKTLSSRHKDKFAQDINLFKFIELDGIATNKYEYISDPLKHKKAFQYAGDYWESLNPKNRWGGNWAKIIVVKGKEKLKGFYDGPHFERRK